MIVPAVLCSILAPMVDSFEVFGYLMWFILFFGGLVLPSITGIMLNSVHENERTSANSIANMCYNLFGYLPAPSFYGMVSSISDGPKSR
jgi:sugar phosphate permease